MEDPGTDAGTDVRPPDDVHVPTPRPASVRGPCPLPARAHGVLRRRPSNPRGATCKMEVTPPLVTQGSPGQPLLRPCLGLWCFRLVMAKSSPTATKEASGKPPTPHAHVTLKRFNFFGSFAKSLPPVTAAAPPPQNKSPCPALRHHRSAEANRPLSGSRTLPCWYLSRRDVSGTRTMTLVLRLVLRHKH